MKPSELLQRLSARFHALDGQKREQLIRGTLVIGGGALLLGVYYGFDRDTPVAAPKAAPAAVIELGDERLEDDIRAQVEKEREESRNKNRDQDTKLGKALEEVELLRKQVQAMEGVAGALNSSTLALPAAEPPIASQAPGRPGQRQPAPNDPIQWAMNTGPTGQELNAAEIKVEFVGGIGTLQAAAPATGEAQKKSKRKFFLPIGYMPARALTGLRAKTVDAASKDPEPILIRIQAPAILPNEVKAALKGCFVIAHGFGSLASERVETRLVTLSCVDYESRSVIEAPLTGIVVDKDGVKGMSGHPVTKMGANMARLFLAGIVEGGADAFRQQGSITSVSPLGQTQTIDPSQVGRAAIGGGLSRGANELTKVYVDLVRQSAPVLETGPGKDVFVLLTQGVWLEVQDYEA